ncbi:hypothetical protein [Phaeovulum sp.]|uniref:hypothetical protein n=1 Tax=Phaeovulum sp. TaxID=2934796 RepID=UPI002731EAF0|nr:hypothetical protein [Phaeovulum sp.]MDP1668603.1 hypothetical protein [Phaeovulum sp.]MDZ4119908.1 hypothetical protein [Phaeovulum sp.]
MIGAFMPRAVPPDILRTVTLFASATSEAATITMPAGVRGGDLAVLFDAPAPGDTARVIPAGFTAGYADMTSGGWGRHGGTAFRIIQSSSEGGTTITGSNGATNNRKILLVFRGNAAIRTATKSVNVTYWGGNNNPGTGTLLATGMVVPSIVVAFVMTYDGAAMVNFEYPYTTPGFAGEVSMASLRAAYTPYGLGATPVNQSVDIADWGSANLYLAHAINLGG